MQRGELAPTSPGASTPYTAEDIAKQLDSWRSTPTPSVASDLVAAAFTLGLEEAATDAAAFLLESADSTPAARSLAAIYLKAPNPTTSEHEDELSIPDSPLLADRRAFIEVSRLRSRLRQYPRSAIEWSDLALHYTSFGIVDKARRAIAVACALAPNNRFVLRAASRFYLHMGDRNRAHAVLARSELLRSDPWVLAAEIAVADATHKQSRRIRHAKKLLEKQHFNAFQLSELASAIGTLEHKSGKHKAGRRLIALSLRDPSENAIAQAEWISRTVGGTVNAIHCMGSPEAAAWKTFNAAAWQDSLEQTLRWLRDQPFSSRPATHGSFVAATILEDYDLASQFASVGLRSSRDDWTLLNNIAFASAMKGELEDAREYLRRLRTLSVTPVQSIAMVATEGLVAFRSGNAELGRSMYKNAVLLARSIGERTREALALAYWAMEELRIGSPNGPERAAAAIDAMQSLDQSYGPAIIESIKRVQKPAGQQPLLRSKM